MALCFRVRFRSTDGAIQGERIAYRLPVRLGRNPLNDCQLAHPTVSEFHAVVDMVGGQLCVRDLNSKNGIYGSQVNNNGRFPPGQPVPLASLQNRFVVAASVDVTIETFEQELNFAERPPSSVHGSVLGNQLALSAGPQPPSLAGPPPPQWGPAGVPSLPALSMAGVPLPPLQQGGAPPAPSAGPMAPPLYSPMPPAAPSLGSSLSPLMPPSYGPLPGGGAPPLNQSLPGLAPLPGEYSPPQAGYGAKRPPAPQPAAGQPAGVSRNTEYLSMPTEALAFAGLRELAASLVPGVRLETTGDVARLLTKLHDLVEVFCRCFIGLRDAHAQFVSSTGLAEPESRHLNLSESARRVQGSRDPAMLAAALLDWRNHDFDPPKVVERELVDIIVHNAALVEGVMRGVESLLEELSPEAVERSVEQGGGVGAMLNKHRTLWRAYEERFKSAADEPHRFELVFGPEFAASYRDYRVQAKSIPPKGR